MKRAWITVVVVAGALCGAGCAVWRDPDQLFRPSERDLMAGRGIYEVSCQRCHGKDGRKPVSLVRTLRVLGEEEKLVEAVLGGTHGPIMDAAGVARSMPSKSYFSDGEIAAVLTFIRNAWGNEAPPVKASTVAKVRAELSTGEPVKRDG